MGHTVCQRFEALMVAMGQCCHIYICMYVCMYVCIVCMYVCMYVGMYVNINRVVTYLFCTILELPLRVDSRIVA